MKISRSVFLVLLLALSSLFVGCASTSHMKVLVSNNRADYSIYCDGELACATSYDCVVSVSSGNDQVQLEARKGEVTHGKLLVDRGEDSYGFNPWLFQHWPLMTGRHPSRSDLFLLVIDAMIFPVAVVEAVIPKKEPGKFPDTVVIPIERNENWVSPWD